MANISKPISLGDLFSYCPRECLSTAPIVNKTWRERLSNDEVWTRFGLHLQLLSPQEADGNKGKVKQFVLKKLQSTVGKICFTEEEVLQLLKPRLRGIQLDQLYAFQIRTLQELRHPEDDPSYSIIVGLRGKKNKVLIFSFKD